VVLLGVGAIGSFICSALGNHDGPVIAIDVEDKRLAVARALGATETHQIERDATPRDVRDLLPDGADVVFETSGVMGAAERAFAMATHGGTVVLVGLNKTPQPLNLADLVLREVSVRTTVAHVCATDIPEALELSCARTLSKTMLDSVVPLADVVELGLDVLVAGAANGKILVDPRDV